MDEAKALTLFEAIKLERGDEVFLEYTGCHTGLFQLTVLKNWKYGMSFHRHLTCPWICYGREVSGKTDWSWRLWRGKPTEWQMKNTPWNIR